MTRRRRTRSQPDQLRIYKLTKAGRKVFWEDQHRAVATPTEHRRILGLVEFQGHSEVIRSYLRRYPDKLIVEWLAEMEESGLIESSPAGPQSDALFLGKDPAQAPPLVEIDRKLLDSDAKAAGISLLRAGVYIADERVKNRPALQKPPGKTTVLIVEDDPDQLALAELRVGMAGYVVHSADSVKRCFEVLRQHGAPDLLLLDVLLPDGNGFDILAQLRRHPTLALLPIVMLTVKDDPADIWKGLSLGADGYVTKPYSKTIVIDVIRRILKH